MKRMLARGTLLVLALVTVSTFTVWAQPLNEHAITKQLKHKVLLLRGRYLCPSPKACKLVFNQQGQLQNKALIGPFSLSAIYVDKVKLSGQNLVLDAHGATILRISKASPVQLRGLLLSHTKLTLQIPINASKQSELQDTLHAIFTDNIQQALNAEPPGQREADLASLTLLTPETKTQAELESKRVGWPARSTSEIKPTNGVKTPKPTYMPTAEFTDRARVDQVQGTCLFMLVVNAQGFPQNIRILKTLPDGLEGRALAAISQYRFRPATQNGKPVPVIMIVEVDFHLH